MTEKIQISGLCINCLNAEECSYRVNHTRPIIFCEEFTCTDHSVSKSNITKVIPKIENSLNFSLKGICSNCENIETCNLQKTDESVISCEEYR
jgi:hypothetical protein